MNQKIVCIGAGPAGLSAAYLLTKETGYDVTILEKDPDYVGGISRTVQHKGFCFDIGGHRFFSKSDEVNALWDEIMGDDFLDRPRKSRIFYGKKFYPYPLELKATLLNMGVFEAAICVLSYAYAQAFPRKPVKSFEDWVINRFGTRLYLAFFKTYTEKVWGMPCNTISADWAAQRIKGLSLLSAIWHAVKPKPKNAPTDRKNVIKTLINTFRYPRKGPGMMWEKARDQILARGGKVHMGSTVVGLQRQGNGWDVTYQQASGDRVTIYADHIICSMPLRDTIRALQHLLPPQAAQAAEKLSYRDFLIVALVVQERDKFDDNWIYIHEPDVKVGRIQNFKSWSPEMVPDHRLNCYGMEYFCFEGDGLWTSTDDDLIALASRELVQLGLAAAEDIHEGYVVRQPKAYPVYDEHYASHVAVIRDALTTHCPGIHVVGRAGMHKYNNQDHAMMTAMLTAQNIMAGNALYDVWNVNQDAEYHEESRGDSGERLVPKAVS